jgi:hypothetical protein
MPSVFPKRHGATPVPLVAYRHDPAIKARYIARVRSHRLADDLVKGFYWMHGKGCAVGCTLEDSDHRRYETELGIPVRVAYLEDAIFEALPNAEARMFPERFLEAIQAGADLSRVSDRFLARLLRNLVISPVRFPKAGYAVELVQSLYAAAGDGARIDRSSWDAASVALAQGLKEASITTYLGAFKRRPVATIDAFGAAALLSIQCAKHAHAAQTEPAAVGLALKKALELGQGLQNRFPPLTGRGTATLLIGLLRAAPKT